MSISRRRKRPLEAMAANSATPIFLLDAKRRIVFFNAGCERLTGWKAEEVLGQVCDYRTATDPNGADALASSLGPPPEVLQGHAARVAAYIVGKSGNAPARRVSYFPLSDSADEIEGILAIISPMEPAPPHSPELPARRLHAELAAMRNSLRQRYDLRSFIARGRPMLRVLEQLATARNTSAGVLFVGATGTGKEHVARAIHYGSAAASGSFVPFDCLRMAPRELKNALRRALESEETGPSTLVRPPGVVYLAEVDHLPRDVQELFVQAAGRAQPGESAPGTPLPRLMAATTRDPRELLEEEVLLPEFFLLASVLTIELPPLSARPDDLPPLAQHFLEAENRGAEHQVGGIEEAVWRKFREYDWPGNLDELQRVIGEARAACRGTMLKVADLPFRFRTGLDAQAAGPPKGRPLPLKPFLTEVETGRIRLALEQAKFNKSQAAELLGISRSKLYRRMETLGIEDREESR